MSSKFRTRWDILIILLSLYVCFVLPLQIAFEPASLEGGVNIVINYISDVIYILDLFVNFRTTVKNHLTNEEITQPSEIAKNYIKGRFWLDLIASIPFDMML